MSSSIEERRKIPVPRQDSIKDILQSLQRTSRPVDNERTAETEPVAKPEGTLALPQLETNIIGIGGKPKAGKDLIIDFLQELYKGIERATFSDFAREEINACMNERDINHYITLENKSFYRPILQEWCAGRREEYGPTYFNAFMSKTIDSVKEGNLLMVTGLRDPAEFDLITEKGGYLWRAVRPGNPFSSDHIVENSADDIIVDREVLNSVEGDLEPFRDNTFEAFQSIIK